MLMNGDLLCVCCAMWRQARPNHLKKGDNDSGSSSGNGQINELKKM